MKGPEEDLVQLLTGADVVISAVNAAVLTDQIPLVDAAKKAGVGRFVPCSFMTVAPPRGVMLLRETVSFLLLHISTMSWFNLCIWKVAAEIFHRKRTSSTTSRRFISRTPSLTSDGGFN